MNARQRLLVLRQRLHVTAEDVCKPRTRSRSDHRLGLAEEHLDILRVLDEFNICEEAAVGPIDDQSAG